MRIRLTATHALPPGKISLTIRGGDKEEIASGKIAVDTKKVDAGRPGPFAAGLPEPPGEFIGRHLHATGADIGTGIIPPRLREAPGVFGSKAAS